MKHSCFGLWLSATACVSEFSSNKVELGVNDLNINFDLNSDVTEPSSRMLSERFFQDPESTQHLRDSCGAIYNQYMYLEHVLLLYLKMTELNSFLVYLYHRKCMEHCYVLHSILLHRSSNL